MAKVPYIPESMMLCLLFSYCALLLITSEERGIASADAQLEVAQLYFDPEYVVSPPAEISYFSLGKIADICPPPAARSCYAEEDTRVCPIPPYTTCYPVYRLEAAVHTLEESALTVRWIARYTDGEETLWQSSWFSRPGIAYLNSTSDRVRDDCSGFSLQLYRLESGSATLLQGVEVSTGVPQYSEKPHTASRDVVDVAVEEHGGLEGILIHVLLGDLGGQCSIRVTIYGSGRAVYSFSKTLSIPQRWDHGSSVSMRVDFGPIRLKRSGIYIVQVHVASGREAYSRMLTYEKPQSPSQLSPEGRTFAEPPTPGTSSAVLLLVVIAAVIAISQCRRKQRAEKKVKMKIPDLT
jgi:hypothetical protein